MQEKGLSKLSDFSVVISYECTATRKDGQPHHAFVSSGYAHRKAAGSSPSISRPRSRKS